MTYWFRQHRYALSAALVWQFGSGWTGLATLLFAYLLIAIFTLVPFLTIGGKPLVLLDLDLPTLSGLDVLKRLSHRKQAEHVPVVVMTAHGSILAAVDAMPGERLRAHLDGDDRPVVAGAVEVTHLELDVHVAGGLGLGRRGGQRRLRRGVRDERR